MTDHVFRQFCLDGTHHPAWDKIAGSSDHPSTAIVFGEKGSGKTALRLQIVDWLDRANRENPDRKTFVIEYDNFNPLLDCFRERLHGRRRKAGRALTHWRLWDHMDSILTIGVGKLRSAILNSQTASGDEPLITRDRSDRLSRLQKRDLLLLAAFYDRSFDQPPWQRWIALKRRLKYSNWQAKWPLALGLAVTAISLALALRHLELSNLTSWWNIAAIAGGWMPWTKRQAHHLWTAWRVSRQIRVIDHVPHTLRRMLSQFPAPEIDLQPTPSKDRSDDRYELLLKFQSILRTLGYPGIVVLVDRVDEPHLVNGSPERMRDLLWPLFDNKFLKHPGIGFKMLLPADVTYYLDREQKEFYERSRLDKQNLIPSLEWTGESLFDIATDRIRACTSQGDGNGAASVDSLFAGEIDRDDLIRMFARLRVPRHLFRFLYRVIGDHCNRHSSDRPVWKIGRESAEPMLESYLRDLQAFDRGLGAG